MENKIGFIGMGAVGKALLIRFNECGLISPSNVLVSRRNPSKLESLRDSLGVEITTINSEVALWADVLLLCTHANNLWSVLDDIKPAIKNTKFIISLSAGVLPSQIQQKLQKPIDIIHIIPTPFCTAGIVAGTSLIVLDKEISAKHLRLSYKLFSTIGEMKRISIQELPSHAICSASSPAFVLYLFRCFLEVADECGVKATDAMTYFKHSFAVIGSMKLDSDSDIRERIDAIKTKSGATEAGLAVLGQAQKQILSDAVGASIERFKSFSTWENIK